MLSNLKLIFIHGVNDQSTNYSKGLFEKIQNSLKKKLKAKGKSDSEITDILQAVVSHNVLWADGTTNLTNRYCQLQYQDSKLFWKSFTKKIDPLAMQIMQYIKDKGDKKTGNMNILKEVDDEIGKIFLQTNIGDFKPGEDKHAIIIAHSLGSVIAFDYVFCFRDKCRLDENATIHSFITMGSPIPIFTSAMGHPDSDLVLPPNVKRWVNIFSKHDGIARSAKIYFNNIDIQEKEVFTGFFPIQSHCGYWKSDKTASIIAEEILEVLDLQGKETRPHLVEEKANEAYKSK